MGFFQKLNEVRAAADRIAIARQRCINSSIHLHNPVQLPSQQLHSRPLTWIAVAGGAGLAAGLVSSIDLRKCTARIWQSAPSREFLRFLVRRIN